MNFRVIFSNPFSEHFIVLCPSKSEIGGEPKKEIFTSSLVSFVLSWFHSLFLDCPLFSIPLFSYGNKQGLFIFLMMILVWLNSFPIPSKFLMVMKIYFPLIQMVVVNQMEIDLFEKKNGILKVSRKRALSLTFKTTQSMHTLPNLHIVSYQLLTKKFLAGKPLLMHCNMLVFKLNQSFWKG